MNQSLLIAKTMMNRSLSNSFLALIFLVSIFSECSDLATGFSTDLIHRDSPHSPSYDPSLSPSQRITNALKRSFHQAQRFDQKRSKHQPEPEPEPYVTSAQGEYLMKFSVGTPPVPSIAIVDTGSDIIWTQCKPCIQCFNQSLPFFSPRNSSSYRRIPCNSPVCASTRDTHCGGARKNCLYSGAYGDGSYTDGILATESFAFPSAAGKAVTIPKVLFGCGFRNGGMFSGIESGIVGLGGGNASLVAQLGPLAQGKFSYCLVPFQDNLNSSKLHFGAEAEVAGEGVVSTPLFVRKGMETYYFLTLEGMSVGNLSRLEFYDDQFAHSGVPRQGNMIIDSGTTLTLLPSLLYSKLEKALKSLIKLKQVQDPSGMLELCYAARGGGGISDFPEITLHFRGADLKWTFENAFVRMSEDLVCLAARAAGEIAIYGNLAQVNFLVGYDLQKSTVSFKPLDCARSF